MNDFTFEELRGISVALVTKAEESGLMSAGELDGFKLGVASMEAELRKALGFI